MTEYKQASRRPYVFIISDRELCKNALSMHSYPLQWVNGKTASVGENLLLGSQSEDCSHTECFLPHCPPQTIVPQNHPFLLP